MIDISRKHPRIHPMLVKLARKLASLPALSPDPSGVTIDRTHFRKTEHPIEIEAAEILLGFPDEELSFLVLRYGLTGSDPLDAPRICQRIGRSFMVTLDIGTGAELRLRNSARAASVIERLAALEMAPLARHVAHRMSIAPSRRWRASRAWMMSRRPIRRLALDTVMEGGAGVLIAQAEEFHLGNRHAISRGHRVERPILP